MPDIEFEQVYARSTLRPRSNFTWDDTTDNTIQISSFTDAMRHEAIRPQQYNRLQSFKYILTNGENMEPASRLAMRVLGKYANDRGVYAVAIVDLSKHIAICRVTSKTLIWCTNGTSGMVRCRQFAESFAKQTGRKFVETPQPINYVGYNAPLTTIRTLIPIKTALIRE